MRILSGRLGNSFLSQGLSSLGNGLMMLAVAGASSPADFGVFALAYTALTFLLAIMRVSFGATISRLAPEPDEARRESAMVVGLLLTLSPVIAATPWVVAQLAPGPTPSTVVLLSLLTPVVLVQDILRYCAISTGVAAAAVLSDGAWAVLSLAGFAWRVVADPQPVAVVAIWGIGAIVGLAILAVATRIRFRLGLKVPGPTGGWRSRGHLLGAGIAGSSSVLLAAAVTTGVAGPAVTAALVGTGQLFAPLAVVTTSIPFAIAPAAAGRPAGVQLRWFSLASGAVAVAALLWAALLLLLPDQVGTALLGDTWESAGPLIPAYAMQAALISTGAAGAALATNIGATQQLWRIRLAQALLRVSVVTAVASVWGTAVALAWSDVGVGAATGAVMWWLLVRTVKHLPESRDR